MKNFPFHSEISLSGDAHTQETLPYSLVHFLSHSRTHKYYDFIHKFSGRFFFVFFFSVIHSLELSEKKFFFSYIFLHSQLVQKERLYDNHHVRYMC